MENKIVNCNGIEISNKNKICLIAGPCQLETEQHALDMAGKIKEITTKYNIGFIYKTSFDKANRTSLKGKRGAGLENSLPVFDKIKNAGSTELDKRIYPVIGLINEWSKDGLIIKGTDRNLGGTMRLGIYEALLKNNSAIKKIYKSSKIKERHRHRYEVNNNLREKFEKNGLIFSGMSPDNKLPEIIELNSHPWFIGVQFHPEFKSRPLDPHPLFSSFIKASKSNYAK